MKELLIIGSRGSKLALWQAEWARSRVSALRPEAEVRVQIIKTSGDIQRDVPLSIIGGKGVFTKELEEALLDGRIDIAVHSLKDLPTVIPERLSITAVSEREDPRDALVLRADDNSDSHSTLKGLPEGASVGTSSLRRMAQLKHLRPDITLKDLRGNVDTRLRKLDDGEYDAIILASAGLRRLGLAHRISTPVSIEEMLPAVGQGALGIETRADDAGTNLLVSLLNHEPTRRACAAERALLRSLGGGCQVPIAAHGVADPDGRLRLEGLVADLSGERVLRDAVVGDDGEMPEQLGERLAENLSSRGADEILKGLTL